MDNASTSHLPREDDVSDQSLPVSWPSTLILISLGYLALCSLLRFQRINRLQNRLGFIDRVSLNRMTLADAQEILRTSINYDFPLLYDLSLRFALIKTYAADNVARLLGASSDLSKTSQAPKRYEDTAILYKCFATFEPHSPQFLKAVARMNYLHAPYIKSGRILNKDLLYVLYASMAEPVRFIRLYEWRELTEMEVAALGTLWKHVADLMGINFAEEMGHDQWRDGFDFMNEVSAWAHKYEDEHLTPTAESKLLGELMMDLLMTSYHPAVTPAAYQAVLVMLGDRLRNAFGYPEPSLTMTTITYSLLSIRRFVVRYLCLPRIVPVKFFSKPDSEGRMHQYSYMKEPWYVAPTFWSRWGPEATITWLGGGKLPGDDGAKWKPEGFLFEEIGPTKTMGKGLEETEMLMRRGVNKSADAAPHFWSSLSAA